VVVLHQIRKPVVNGQTTRRLENSVGQVTGYFLSQLDILTVRLGKDGFAMLSNQSRLFFGQGDTISGFWDIGHWLATPFEFLDKSNLLAEQDGVLAVHVQASGTTWDRPRNNPESQEHDSNNLYKSWYTGCPLNSATGGHSPVSEESSQEPGLTIKGGLQNKRWDHLLFWCQTINGQQPRGKERGVDFSVVGVVGEKTFRGHTKQKMAEFTKTVNQVHVTFGQTEPFSIYRPVSHHETKEFSHLGCQKLWDGSYNRTVMNAG
jgi:hypothetical protein